MQAKPEFEYLVKRRVPSSPSRRAHFFVFSRKTYLVLFLLSIFAVTFTARSPMFILHWHRVQLQDDTMPMLTN